MKTSLTYSKQLLIRFAIALILVASVSAAKAQVLLEINISNPNDVTITATDTLPTSITGTITDSLSDGVDLIGFFNGSSGYGDGVTNNATGSFTSTNNAGTANVFDSGYADNLVEGGIGGNYSDLLLWSNSFGGATETFSDSSTAFTGTLTLDLSGESLSNLPVAGKTGAIYSGWSGNGGNPANVQIGSYEVVGGAVTAPEPSSWLLVLAGLIGLGIYRTRRTAPARR